MTPEYDPKRTAVLIIDPHWARSGFAGTDLNTQLTQHGVTHVIAIGSPPPPQRPQWRRSMPPTRSTPPCTPMPS